MFLKLYTNLYKTDMHKQASFVALNCLTVAKSLYNTSQINSWGYYLWSHFLRWSERYLQTLPFSSLQRFKLTDLPLMSTTLKLQTDVTSLIYPSFLNFFASMPPIRPSTFLASIVDKKIPKKFQFLMTSYLIIPHEYSRLCKLNHAYSYLFKAGLYYCTTSVNSLCTQINQ